MPTKRLKKTIKNKESLITRVILVALIILFLGMMIGVIGYTLIKNFQYKNTLSFSVINVSVEIVDYNIMGLSADRDSLNYGKVTIGNSGTRFVNISTEQDAIVRIYIYGNITEFISVDNPTFSMKANTNMLIPFYLDTFQESVPGKYSGEIHIQIIKQ